MKQLLPQHCPLPFLYLAWVVYIAGTVYLAATGEFTLAGVWLIVLPTAWWLYVRLFPSLSPYLGYGRVDDAEPAAVVPQHVRVTMYSSVGCPFCPLVEERLRVLKQEMGFELEHVDVTLRPELLRAKSIRSVPVVEVGDRRLVGHATTRELAELIGGGG
jgi:glutaredoxin